MKINLEGGKSVTLADRYLELGARGTLPKLTLVALGTYGVKEVPGPGNDPAIMSWSAALVRAGLLKAKQYDRDATPWCGLGMAYWCLVAGKPPMENPLWALNWRAYGNCVGLNTGSIAQPKLAFGPAMAASIGDILVFSRPLGTKPQTYAGHVGTYIAEDKTHYHVLGCNQGDAVSIVRIAKDRCVAVRRPAFQTAMPRSATPMWVTPTGEAAGSLA